jgi:hypothetical protein
MRAGMMTCPQYSKHETQNVKAWVAYYVICDAETLQKLAYPWIDISCQIPSLDCSASYKCKPNINILYCAAFNWDKRQLKRKIIKLNMLYIYMML